MACALRWMCQHGRMRHWIPAAFALSLTFGPLSAAEPLSGAEFEAYTTGRTLYFGQNGQEYGVEQYLDNRRVRWSFLDGKCKDGYWYEDNRQICFVYEDSSQPHCWSFFRAPNGLRAVFEDGSPASDLYEARKNDEPMLCFGPEIGV